MERNEEVIKEPNAYQDRDNHVLHKVRLILRNLRRIPSSEELFTFAMITSLGKGRNTTSRNVTCASLLGKDNLRGMIAHTFVPHSTITVPNLSFTHMYEIKDTDAQAYIVQDFICVFPVQDSLKRDCRLERESRRHQRYCVLLIVKFQDVQQAGREKHTFIREVLNIPSYNPR